MKNVAPNVIFVSSAKKPAQVEVSGFEHADDSAHMIEWLGKGKDFRLFITSDVEAELYAQDPGSQLLSINCTAKPEYQTKLLRQSDRGQGILSEFSVTFSIMLRVMAANGVVWSLGVRHNYHASNLEVPGNHKLQLNFTIVSHASEQ